jgi:hypothetical protein
MKTDNNSEIENGIAESVDLLTSLQYLLEFAQIGLVVLHERGQSVRSYQA